jgi:hypothetical protein
MKQVIFILLVFISFQGFSQNIKISKCFNLEVMKTDLGKMTWYEAMKKVAELGDGWRLPTIEELHIMYSKRGEIGGLKDDDLYWSSEEYDAHALLNAWIFSFNSGDAGGSAKYLTFYVRAVRDLE